MKMFQHAIFSGLCLMAVGIGALEIVFLRILTAGKVLETSFTYYAVRLSLPVVIFLAFVAAVFWIKARALDAIACALLAFCVGMMGLSGALVFQWGAVLIRLQQ
jgi:hypothetical protein